MPVKGGITKKSKLKNSKVKGKQPKKSTPKVNDVQRVRNLEDESLNLKFNQKDDLNQLSTIITKVIKELKNNDIAVVFASQKILERTFIKFFQDESYLNESKEKGFAFHYRNKSTNERKKESEEKIYSELLGKYREYINSLIEIALNTQDETLKAATVQTIMIFIQIESQKIVQEQEELTYELFKVEDSILNQLFHQLITKNDVPQIESFITEYILPLEDIKFASLKALGDLVNTFLTENNKSSNKDDFARCLYAMLRPIKIPSFVSEILSNPDSLLLPYVPKPKVEPVLSKTQQKKKKAAEKEAFELGLDDEDDAMNTDNMDIDSNDFLGTYKKQFTTCWMSFLKLTLPVDLFKKVLIRMHVEVIPYFTSPILLMDYLTDSYNYGGVISLLALNSLFVLITQFNLNYPDFYQKLYSLFEPSIFFVKYRSRFFHLANIFLSSTHLPVYLVCAFAKRTARLSLQAPPSSVIICLSFIYNILKRHKESRILIHRPPKESLKPILLIGSSGFEIEGDKTKKINQVSGFDPYKYDEVDYSKSNASQSSLWEINALQKHYSPMVSKLANVFQSNIDSQLFPLEPTLDESYQTMFDNETAKMAKKAHSVPMVYNVKPVIFEKESDLWSFE